MKLRTSSFNLTVLKKDITRFAPAWILYTVGLLVTVMVCRDSAYGNRTAEMLGRTAYAMAIVSFCYALLNAQLLFGDLFQSRMTNGLHALPLRREEWFSIHTVAGLLFAFVPNLIMALCMVPFSSAVPAMPWMWLLWANGTYLFFFGVAALCAMCVGSRFAMVVVYGIVNFGSLLILWLYDTVYRPMLYGLTTNAEPFLKFSPVSYGTVYIPYTLDSNWNTNSLLLSIEWDMVIYLAIITAVGILAGALALVMYRKRHLESAGDFISAPWLKPVFLVFYTIAMGVVFQFVLGLFTGTEWLYLAIGLTVGFLTGQMLLMRTTRIFVKETFRGLAAVLAVTAVTLGLTAMDPLGLTRWVPEGSDVEHIQVQVAGTFVDADAGEDMEVLLRFHQAVIDNRDEPLDTDLGNRASRIFYTMADGRTVERYYLIPAKGTAHMTLVPLLSRPDVVLGDLYYKWQEDGDQIDVELFDSKWDGVEVEILDNEYPLRKFTREDWIAFISAVEADCAEGTLIQDRSFHEDHQVQTISFHWMDVDERGITFYRYSYLEIFPDSTHVLEWLKNHPRYEPDTDLAK